MGPTGVAAAAAAAEVSKEGLSLEALRRRGGQRGQACKRRAFEHVFEREGDDAHRWECVIV
jgi:hypothetical protein